MITVQYEDQYLPHEDEKEIDEKDDRIKEPKNHVISYGNPYLSLHALEGTFNYQTMRIKGLVGKIYYVF